MSSCQRVQEGEEDDTREEAERAGFGQVVKMKDEGKKTRRKYM